MGVVPRQAASVRVPGPAPQPVNSTAEGVSTMPAIFQSVALAAVAVYLCWWAAALRRRNARSWDSLMARLSLDWSARELSDLCLPARTAQATPGGKWRRIWGARGLWAMYRNAGVMLELANYAARNSDSVEPDLLRKLRADAMCIRLCILKTIAEFALSTAQESICMQALRAESAYAEMELRVAEFLEANAPQVAPSFAGCV